MSVEIIEGDCHKILSKFVEEGKKFDCIILDPPYTETDIYSKPKLNILVPKLYSLLENNRIMFLFGEGRTLIYDYCMHYSKMFNILWELILIRNTGIPPSNSKFLTKKHQNVYALYKKHDKYNKLKIKILTEQKHDHEHVKYGSPMRKHAEMKRSVGYYHSVQYIPQIQSTKEYAYHPNQKPIKIIDDLIKMVYDGKKTFTVLDPFAGSGTTGVVCALNNINCTLIEIEHQYVEIIKERVKNVEKCNITSYFA
jgi:DNA modification methylase